MSEAETKLKSERVQEQLRSLPGWRLFPGGQAIGRVREFAEPDHAEAFAAFVARLSLTQRHPVKIDLTPSQVLVTLQGGASDDCTAGVTEAVLALASAIG